MNILVASDSFKGCMTSKEANAHVKKGLKRASDDFQVQTFPVADGGEGLVEAFADLTHSQIITVDTVDLYFQPIQAPIGYDPVSRTACIEAASVVGLPLYPKEKRKPLDTSSYGLGVLMKKAMELEIDRLIIGLGGTGTNDGGIGLLQAFGAVLYNRSRKPLEPVTRNLGKVAFIDKSRFSFNRRVQIEAACDVKNPLLGPNGATYIYGRQKGLSRTEQSWIEEGMRRFEAKVSQTFHAGMNKKEGAGAAGGLGGMLQAVFKASFVPGLEVLAALGNLDEKMEWADLVISGEGQTDAQTLNGKAVLGIAQKARNHNVPVVCLSGALGLGYEGLYDYGICSMLSTADRAMSFSTAIKEGPVKLEKAAENLGRMLEGLNGCLK